MRYIPKQEEPAVLTNFKAQANEDWQPRYDNFSGKVKHEFHDRLITEQGYICCYCGGRIARSDSHIEHFRPQTGFRELELDYSNLLVSCQQQIAPKEPRHCGIEKGDWFCETNLVSPLLHDCEEFFEYTIDGQILPTRESLKSDAAAETIAKLSLNIPKLKALRAGAIASLYDDPNLIAELSDDEIDKLIYGLDSIDNNGQYQSYCQAIVYLLKQEKMCRDRSLSHPLGEI